MNPLEITLVILLVTIIAFVSGKVPFSVISTGIILALILTGIKTPAEAFGGFINTNVVMFVAMFVIGAGLTKTPLIDKAQSLVIRYKDNMRMLIFLSCVAGAFLGAITSATATAAIMIPLLVGIANDIGVSRSKLLYPSMACANIATQMTFLGQGASNMAWNDVMMQAGAPTPLHIWDFTIARMFLIDLVDGVGIPNDGGTGRGQPVVYNGRNSCVHCANADNCASNGSRNPGTFQCLSQPFQEGNRIVQFIPTLQCFYDIAVFNSCHQRGFQRIALSNKFRIGNSRVNILKNSTDVLLVVIDFSEIFWNGGLHRAEQAVNDMLLIGLWCHRDLAPVCSQFFRRKVF